MTLKKIPKYGKENELEENLYSTACDVCFSDGELHDDERELLDTLAELLELSKFDKRKKKKKILRIFYGTPRIVKIRLYRYSPR